MSDRLDELLIAGDRLKKWRDSVGISQEAAAKRIQSTQGAWGAWERGLKAPDLVFAFAIEKLTEGAVPAEVWAVSRQHSRIARGIGADDADQTGPRQAIRGSDQYSVVNPARKGTG